MTSMTICFQETRISDIPFDRSMKQGGKESPILFKLDDEKCLQDNAKRMEGSSDGGKNKR